MAGPGREASAETKRRLVDAAARTLREVGYAGASTRVIARAADANPALIFYHFGGVDALLLAAFDDSSQLRMERHQTTVADVRTVKDLAAAATQMYRYDLDGGHITLFTELVAASIANPQLRAEIVARAEPWLDFIEETITRVIGGTPLGALASPRDLAYAAMTFYLGVNLFSVLDPDHTRTEALFALATRLAPRARLLTMRLPGRRARGGAAARRRRDTGGSLG